MIEACLLFSMEPEAIQVVIHKTEHHSFHGRLCGWLGVAQMGNPDMRIPIAHAMAWPDRFDSGVEPLDIFAVGQMDFEPPSYDRFPCLRLAYEAIKAGGVMPAVLNAANEIAVESFLNEQIRFTDIAVVIEQTMLEFSPTSAQTLEQVLQADQQARSMAQQKIEALTH